MNSFLLAVQFLTIIPLKIKEVSEKGLANSAAYFPLAGLLIGLLLLGINYFTSILSLPLLTSNIILVVSLIVITGGMHLDGLADTADAFLSGKSKEEMLLIMRDSHIGVMGVLSIVSVILLKIGLLVTLSAALKPIALILMCVLSRWAVVLVMFLFPYARKDGKAGVFIRGIKKEIVILALGLACLFAFIAGSFMGLVVLLIASGCAYSGGKFTSRKIDGITGDTLGAAIELTEIVVLSALVLFNGG